MYYVYRIQSECDPTRYYTGFTEDLKKRLKYHNYGKNISTAHFRPWKLIQYTAFSTKESALAFEAYLKTGSGTAFAKKRLWPS